MSTPAPEPYILKFFHQGHLPEGAGKDLSRAFTEVAKVVANTLPPSAELSAGLRKLLEAKDCIVRAAFDSEGRIQ